MTLFFRVVRHNGTPWLLAGLFVAAHRIMRPEWPWVVLMVVVLLAAAGISQWYGWREYKRFMAEVDALRDKVRAEQESEGERGG